MLNQISFKGPMFVQTSLRIVNVARITQIYLASPARVHVHLDNGQTLALERAEADELMRGIEEIGSKSKCLITHVASGIRREHT